MSEYIYSTVCLAVAVGIVLLIAPDGARQGLKKHIKLIGSLCLICVLIKPTTELLEAIDRLTSEGFSGIFESESESEIYDKYENIYQDYLSGTYGKNIGEAVKDGLLKRFGIAKDECRVISEFEEADSDAVSEPKKITVVLSGNAKFKEPNAIKAFIEELFECDAAVAIE